MKRLFIFILLVTFTFSINAQRYMSVTKKDGSVTEYALSAIDSIHFFVKDNTTPEPPVVNPDDPFENGHEYVDLGLPSGTLWATMNVGAETITDYGDYFAWGETTTKQSYSLNTYKWYTSETITDQDGFETTKDIYLKYCTNSENGMVDNLTTLELEDDAAYVNWGGAWRMPTIVECDELLNNCTWTWVTLNGVNGYKVSSKVTGNTNYIFLPAAGRCLVRLTGDGSDCEYSSSSLRENLSAGAYVVRDKQVIPSQRYIGRSVRPVCSSKKE